MYDIVFIDIPNLKISRGDELGDLISDYYRACNKITEKITGKKTQEKPFNYTLGLLCLAGYLKKFNYKIGYLNYNMHSDIYEKIVKETKILCFSTMTITLNLIIKLAKEAKIYNKNLKIVFGGYHASYRAKELLEQCEFLDIVIIKEGEQPLKKYLEGTALKDIPGIAYRRDNRVIINREEDSLEENAIPSPDFSLLGNNINMFNIHISTMRGCIGNCNFCVNHDYWGKPRLVSLEKIEQELIYLERNLSDNTLIHFSDNVFTYNKKRLKNLNEIINAHGKKFVYECDTLSSLIDDEIVHILEDMNVIQIHLGFEDCVDNILQISNKCVRHKQNLRALDIIAKNAKHICVYVYWLIGLPGANKFTFKINRDEIRRLLMENKVHIVSPKIFIPYPGTTFFDNPKKYGISEIKNNWDEYERRTPPFPYELNNLSSRDIYEELVRVMEMCQTIYANKLKEMIE